MYLKKRAEATVECAVEKRELFSSKTISFVKGTLSKYTLYLLSVILFFAVVLVILKFALFTFPESSANNLPTANLKTDAPISATSFIMPKTAIYYHGVRLGEFEGDNKSVLEVLSSYNIKLSKNDEVSHPLDSKVTYGMTLSVDEITYREEIEEEVLAFSTNRVESHNVPKGSEKVVTEGKNGSLQRVVRTKLKNGEATDEVEEFERRVEPVNEEIEYGVGGVFTAPDGKEYKYSYYLDVTATAYTHTGDPTYMGTVAEVGVIAVDPRNIDLGSNVYVIGNYGDYGVCRAEDIGGGIKGLRIDVFLDSEEECVVFGRRKMRAYVLEE